jgi:RNA polymerase sigma-70 factor (ECF subfamily)
VKAPQPADRGAAPHGAVIQTSAPGIDDAALVARLRAGDDEAFELVVRTYSGRLLAVTRRILVSDEDARDALQDAFLSAFRSLDRFEGGSLLSTWLHRIAVNAALMKVRTRRRRPEESIESLLPVFREDGHHQESVASWTEPADVAMARAESRALVRQCIDQLPDSYRTVLLLRDIEEMDTAEAAQALGISANAVKIRLHRARQALRTLLAPHFRKAQP